MHLPKILVISQGISFCIAAIMRDNNNNNIRFFLWDIAQVYDKIALNFNLDSYIQPFSKLVSQLNASFNSVIIVIRPFYSKPKINKYRFAIYHLHYKDNNLVEAMT